MPTQQPTSASDHQHSELVESSSATRIDDARQIGAPFDVGSRRGAWVRTHINLDVTTEMEMTSLAPSIFPLNRHKLLA